MSQSVRILYKGVTKGRHRRNFNWAPISEKSAVFITAAEWSWGGHGGGGHGIVFNQHAGRTHLGAGDVYVTNIGVHGPEGGDGGVEFHLHTNADLIDVVVTITVLDTIPDKNWVRA